MKELQKTIARVQWQLYANGGLKALLLAAAAYLLSAAFLPATTLPWLVAALVFGVGMVAQNVFVDKKPEAVSLIHQAVGEAEYSLNLLDKAELNLAEQLQVERLNERIARVAMPPVVFTRLGGYAGALGVGLLVYLGAPLLKPDAPARQRLERVISAVTREAPPVPAFESASLTIQPPSYTGLPLRRSADLNVAALSGSVLRWSVRFSRTEGLRVRLTNSRGEERAFRQEAADFVYTDRLLSSGLYAIKAYWRAPSGRDSLVYQSDFYRLEAQPDLAPSIQPVSRELYTYHYLKDDKTIRVSARISDDFRVNQAFIVATVARGSGENVKFREVRMPLTPANFRDERITKTIDLRTLNFAPGDELYYYWAAVDNRQPEANFTKSDTYFIVYKDTTKLEEAELATMAVNIMPEYFRSQRQIIIDTEKLLAKKKKLSPQQFNSTSNEIGFDQKVLRLRYGQYLGEEFETNIGPGGGIPEGAGEGKDPLEGFVHKHDQEGAEHDHAREPGHDHDHGHNHGHSPEADNKDPLAALMEQYVHSHDDAEANTFYEQSTRSLLKMALEQMWQSELHLRLYEPEKALPFERKALEYLKAAQHKARTFVKKSGYDPPPIKEAETRLTGELEHVVDQVRLERRYTADQLARLIGTVLGYLERDQLTAAQKGAVQQLSGALASRNTATGLPNWAILGSLQKLAGGKPLDEREKQVLKARLYRLLEPVPGQGPAQRGEPRLEKAFWKRLTTTAL